MQSQHITTLIGLLASIFVASVVLTAQSQDRFSLKAANGIAFSEFRGYDAWQLVATSQPDNASGCGTSKVGCMKAILGNADDDPGVPRRHPGERHSRSRRRGARQDRMAAGPRREALRRDRVRHANRDVLHGEGLEAIPGHKRMGVRRHSRTTHRPTPSSRPQPTPHFARACHGCHTAHAKARDFVFTDYATR